ncbi:hypothetical protein KFE98_01600 [bacterium SCSIO 12741]|nr:hypothetical protein KFE98_01600 [bacterium SCSIO 12741]
MPLFNQDNPGIYIQIGPANGDLNYNAAFNDVKSGAGPTYSSADALGAYDYNNQMPCEFKNMPSTFGVGLPWFQVKHLYEYYYQSSPDDIYNFWWNDQSSGTYTWDNTPTLANDEAKLRAVELIRYSKNPYMLSHVKKYVINGAVSAQAATGLTGPGISQVADYELTYTTENYQFPSYRGANPAQSEFYRTAFLLESVRENPTYPTNNAQQSTLTQADYDAAPLTQFDYGTAVNYGDTFCTGVGDCELYLFTFYPLTEVVNPLGGKTKITYQNNPNFKGQTTEVNYSGRRENYAWKYQKRNTDVVQLNHQVSAVELQDENGWQTTSYQFSNPTLKHELQELNTSHFKTHSRKSDIGFTTATVTHPAINGKENTTVYTHYTTELGGLVFGKLKTIEKKDDNGVLFEKTEISFDTTHAFENGFFKHSNVFNRNKWRFDYTDRVLSSTDPFFDGGAGDEQVSSADIQFSGTTPRTTPPVFYEAIYADPNDRLYWDSWFIKKTQTKTTEYDPNGCVIDDSYYLTSGGGFTSNPYDHDVLTQVLGVGTGSEKESILIENSPLSDSLQYYLTDPAYGLSNENYSTVFSHQDHIQEDVLDKLIDRIPLISEDALKTILLSQNRDYSQELLETLMDYPSLDDHFALKETMIAQDSIGDSVFYALMDRTQIDRGLLKTVLLSREHISGNVIERISDSVAVWTDGGELLKSAAQSSAVYPNNTTMNYLAGNAVLSDNLLKDLFTACPYQTENAVISTLDSRFPNIDPQIRADIVNSQTGKPIYTNYLDSMGYDTLWQAALYVNTSEVVDLQKELDLIEQVEENNLNEEDFITEASDLSPLRDTVLLAILKYASNYSSETWFSVLSIQPAFSDQVVQTIIDEPTFQDHHLTALLNAQPSGLSEVGLATLLQRISLVGEEMIKPVLLTQPVISEANFNHLLSTTYSNGLVEALLHKRGNFSDSFLTGLMGSSRNFSSTVIAQVLLKQHHFPSDNVLHALLDHTPTYDEDDLFNVLASIDRPYDSLLLPKINSTLPTYNVLLGYLNNKLKVTGNAPNLTYYCNNPYLTQALSIETITQYDYYEANYKGETTTEGYAHLLPKSGVASNQLLFEPTWQLYRQKTYSPQLPGAFDQKEYFYYYDLKNRYDNTTCGTVDNTSPIYSNTRCHATAGTNGAINKSHRHGLRDIVFEQRQSSRYAINQDVLTRSNYYLYDTLWNPMYEPEDTVITINGDPCGPVVTFEDSVASLGCQQVKVPFWYATGNIGFWNIVMYVKTQPDYTFYACPCEGADSARSWWGWNVGWSNPVGLTTQCLGDSIETEEEGGGAEQVLVSEYYSGRFLMLRSIHSQVDTLSLDDWNNYTAGNYGASTAKKYLLEFEDHDVVFPYDTLRTFYVHDRGEYGQVKLYENERGLKTRLYYGAKKDLYYMDPNCHRNDYSGFYNPAPGLPYRVTQGYGRSDSLSTTFSYYPNKELKNSTDPNGMLVQGDFDAFGRLERTYRNGELTQRYDYHFSNGTNGVFATDAENNYTEVFTRNRVGSNAGSQLRTYLDPLGREFYTVNAMTSDVTQGSSHFAPYVNSGSVSYDDLNRRLQSFRPFARISGSMAPQGNGQYSGADATNHQAYAYEEHGKNRILFQAEPGEDINTGHVKAYEYQMTNYLCMFCDLGVSLARGQQLMPALSALTPDSNYVFSKQTMIDEDGKMTATFTNALGQKVATKSQISNTRDAVTLFLYDAYGNLTQTINPEDNPTYYDYNILGWIYRQVAPADGGEKKFQYDLSGNVVLEIDENGKADPDSLIYRKYEYDAYGRMTVQYRLSPDHIGENASFLGYHFDYLIYEDDTLFEDLGSGYYNYEYIYDFSGRSTLSWLNSMRTGNGTKYPGSNTFTETGTLSLWGKYKIHSLGRRKNGTIRSIPIWSILKAMDEFF